MVFLLGILSHTREHVYNSYTCEYYRHVISYSHGHLYMNPCYTCHFEIFILRIYYIREMGKNELWNEIRIVRVFCLIWMHLLIYILTPLVSCVLSSTLSLSCGDGYLGPWFRICTRYPICLAVHNPVHMETSTWYHGTGYAWSTPKSCEFSHHLVPNL